MILFISGIPAATLHIGQLIIPFRIEEWINDGLMTIFFLLVGLEIERELYIGELSSFKNAALPILAAIGGMLVPALIHFLFNHGKPEQAGIGIPMATDIAFSLGVLSLIGKRIPLSLKIFLTALAIIDDLGAVIIIAIFYTQSFSFFYLSLGAGSFSDFAFIKPHEMFSRFGFICCRNSALVLSLQIWRTSYTEWCIACIYHSFS